MALEFTPESEAKVKEFEETYYNKMACLLPTLWVAQDQFGYLPPEALDLVAERLELPRMHVESVASFYHLYKREKVGRHHIQICRTLSCAMFGSQTLLEHLEEKYNLKPGEVTPDGKFSLETAECLALCGTGPAMLINKDTYEHVTVEKLDKILDSLE